MLLEISIKNFAIIEEISLNFENGMTVLTGETGAGKSIIIDAMNMMLGARASTEVIRRGANKAEIEGVLFGRCYPRTGCVSGIIRYCYGRRTDYSPGYLCQWQKREPH